MTGTWALVKDGLVINTIAWDGPDSSPIVFEEGVEAVEYTEESPAGTGYLYANGKFSTPSPTNEEIELVKTQIKEGNISSKKSLLDEAVNKMFIWQTKLLIGKKLSESESASLSLWMDYSDAVDTINAEVSEQITWPEKP